MKSASYLATLTLFLACDGGAPAASEAPCDPEQRACAFTHDYGKSTLAPGQEVSGECNSWTLHNPQDLWVSAVELSNDGAYHHSNWFYVPDRSFEHPDGKWPCKELHFTEVGAALLGGVLYAQTTQVREEVQRFPHGAVLRVPAWSRIIGSVHLLNVSARAVETGLRMRIVTVPPGETRVKLAPLRLSYYDLHLPPQARSEFIGDCDLRRAYQDLRQEPLRMKLYYVLPHYHELGRRFRVSALGGPQGGAPLYEYTGSLGEPGGHAFDPPVDIGAGDGMSISCTYDNPRDREVGWGIGDQEMCVMLGFTESPVAVDAFVEKGARQGEQGGVVQHRGACTVRAFNYYSG